MKSLYRLSFLPILCGLLLARPLLAADEYLMEMVVFEQPDGYDEVIADDRPQADRIVGSLATGGPGIAPLGIDDGRLGPVAYTLGRKGARVLAHLRWRHDFATPGSDGWIRVTGKDLEGSVRLRKGRYIHMFTDLQPADSEHPVREHGRLRSGELYYIDHPRIGILVRADRLEEPSDQATETPPPREDEVAPARPATPADENPPEQRAPAGDKPRATPDTS